MTEEIIIDGMDITDCEQAKSCACCRCKNMAYYSLKQENEKLDNEAQEYHNTIMKLDDLVKELRQENEQLCEDNTRLGNNFDYANDEIQYLHNVLEEIREISNNMKITIVKRRDLIQDKINEVI